MRPGAISSTVWIALASTEAWRVSGLVTAGNNVKPDVWADASAIVTNVSRHSSWLSRIPAPSKPAASTSWISWISSGIGAVPGIRSETWTRFMAVGILRRTGEPWGPLRGCPARAIGAEEPEPEAVAADEEGIASLHRSARIALSDDPRKSLHCPRHRG